MLKNIGLVGGTPTKEQVTFLYREVTFLYRAVAFLYFDGLRFYFFTKTCMREQTTAEIEAKTNGGGGLCLLTSPGYRYLPIKI